MGRGLAFEQMIEYSNNMYLRKGLCVVNKRPTPVKIMSKHHGKVWGFMERKSTVDFDGVLPGGRAIVFEAKESKEIDHFPLKNIQQHQVDYLLQCHNHGAVSFVLIHMDKQRKIYLLPAESLKSFWERRKKGGRGSARITIDELDVYAYEVPSGQVPVDYLAVVNKVWRVAV